MLDIGAGVIDEDYRGEGSHSFYFNLHPIIVGVVLFNHGVDTFEVKKGDRIAQLIITKITPCLIIEVEELMETKRGDGGFGSTGVSEKLDHNHKDYNPMLNDKIFHQVRFANKAQQE